MKLASIVFKLGSVCKLWIQRIKYWMLARRKRWDELNKFWPPLPLPLVCPIPQTYEPHFIKHHWNIILFAGTWISPNYVSRLTSGANSLESLRRECSFPQRVLMRELYPCKCKIHTTPHQESWSVAVKHTTDSELWPCWKEMRSTHEQRPSRTPSL